MSFYLFLSVIIRHPVSAYEMQNIGLCIITGFGNKLRGFTSWCLHTNSCSCLRIKADSHIACRANAAPLPFPCHAVPLRIKMCLSHLIYKVRPCLIHTSHAIPMSCSDHAVLLKATEQQGLREKACGLPARVRLLPATTRISTKTIRSKAIFLTTFHTYDCKEW